MMLCEMLGTSIDDINLYINVRNRRQRVLKNISFESEGFNIYDPEYTSQEEMDSVLDNNKGKSEEEDSWYNDTEKSNSF